MTFRYLFLLPAVFLSGCAYLTETAIQDLTVETPGAKNAICYVYVDGLKYKFYPPQTINIKKSHQDLVLDCIAPGGRVKKMTVSPEGSDYAVGNVVTGAVPGLAWDAASGALWKYPDVIQVDFNGVESSIDLTPVYNNPDIEAPETHRLEEFLPSEPRLNSDLGRSYEPLQKKEIKKPAKYGTDFIQVDDGKDNKSNPPNVPASDIINPAAAPTPQASPATDDPAPLYPGQ